MLAMNDILNLISVSKTKDADGFTIETTTAREIFCAVKSVNRTEFYEALRSGIKAAVIFTINADDYQGEQDILYNNKKYKILRNYQTSEYYIELTCEAVK